MLSIPPANIKLIIVLMVIGSLNINQLNQVNTIAPIENPIKQTLIDGAHKYNAFNDVVDMDNGEVSYDNDGGFGVKKLNKRIIKKGKIKDLKK